MARFVVDRLIQAVAALLVLSAIVFGMSRATGDPLSLLLPLQATQGDFDRVRHALGLDEPIPTQYLIFLGNAVRGDLGRSQRSGEEVTQLVLERLAGSVELAAAALVLTAVVAIPLGVIGALRRGTALDTLVKLVALLGQSMPSFWVGILLIQIFAVWLRILPSGTNQSPAHVILPAFTLSLFGIAGVARLLRSSMLEVLDSEFVKLARAKGMLEKNVIWKHALRNSLLPVVSFSGLFFVNLLSLTIVVETVFAWPGMGSLTYSAILNRDFPVIQGVTLAASAIAILVNMFTDILYTYLDPRIRYAAT